MFMVNSSKEGTSFWANNKTFFDGLIKAGFIVVALKTFKYALDQFQLWPW